MSRASYANTPGKDPPTMRTLELRRHARRDPAADRLSPAGRAQAAEVGKTLAGSYAVVFVSPAQRAAETVAWLLQGLGEQLPEHAVVPGLGGVGNDGSPEALAGVVRDLFWEIPEGARALAVGHTPLIERAVFGLTGREISPLAECEGVVLAQDADSVRVDEIRI